MEAELKHFREKWDLGEAQPLASTATAELYQVDSPTGPAVLKIFSAAAIEAAARSTSALQHYGGGGAVRLLRHGEGAQLLELIDGPAVSDTVKSGKDAEATRVICQVIRALHAASGKAPAGLWTMERNFRSLFQKAGIASSDPIFREGARMAEDLLAAAEPEIVLHGDLHHENVKNSSRRAWLAIDPHGVSGQRTFEVANTFYNPKGMAGFLSDLGTLRSRARIFSEELGLSEQRIFQFAFAYGCLSAAWQEEDGESCAETLMIARSIQLLTRS